MCIKCKIQDAILTSEAEVTLMTGIIDNLMGRFLPGATQDEKDKLFHEIKLVSYKQIEEHIDKRIARSAELLSKPKDDVTFEDATEMVRLGNVDEEELRLWVTFKSLRHVKAIFGESLEAAHG
jgi:hypothetical protein